jgi:hypothetical protein
MVDRTIRVGEISEELHELTEDRGVVASLDHLQKVQRVTDAALATSMSICCWTNC